MKTFLKYPCYIIDNKSFIDRLEVHINTILKKRSIHQPYTLPPPLTHTYDYNKIYQF